jgi:ferric-dicitrate binding protein FerR (iron transport regulator)
MKKVEHKDTSNLISGFYVGREQGSLSDETIRTWLDDERVREDTEDVLKQIWDRQVRETEPDKEAYAGLADLRSRLGFERKPLLMIRRSLVRVAAVFVLFLALGGVTFFALHSKEESLLTRAPLGSKMGRVAVAGQTGGEIKKKNVTVQADQAGRVHVVLPDGSEAWVHRKGKVTYSDDFSTQRIVYLEGEAYFSVVKQDGKPFIVKGDGISVRVLGTEFLMTAGVGSLSCVEVAQGAVEVTVRDSTYQLGALDRLVFEKRMEALLHPEVVLSVVGRREEIALWKNLNLVFEDRTLEETLRRISSYYGVDIAIDERLLPDERLTVRFTGQEPLNEVLDIIRKTLGSFDFEITEDDRVIVTPNHSVNG